MSKPRYRWWGYIKNVIRAYPRLKQEYEYLHEQSITPSMSGMPGGGGASRAVENIAIRELPGAKQREYEAVKRAVEATQRLDTGKETLDIVNLLFWKQKHRRIEDAAYEVGTAPRTARRYLWRFVMLVAKNYGLLSEEEYEAAIKTEKWTTRAKKVC